LQRREVRRRGRGSLDVVAIEGGEQKRWHHIDDGPAVGVEHALRQKREVRPHRQGDARMRGAGTDTAANQREILAGFADDGRDDGRARCHDIPIHCERRLGHRAHGGDDQGNDPDDRGDADARNDALVGAASL
jgi:hypothetical protein